MISASARWTRFILSILLILVFILLARVLYKKQQEKYNYNSFHVENELFSALFPNADRLVKKLSSTDALMLPVMPANLTNAIEQVLNHPNFSFSENLSKDCYLSCSETDFLIAFKTTSPDAYDLAEMLQTYFDVTASASESGLSVDGKNYLVSQFNHYLVISTQPLTPQISTQRENYGNADFVLFSNEFPRGQRHILSSNQHQLVWEDSVAGPYSPPILHAGYLPFVPASFSELHFYGSHAFNEDSKYFFAEPDEQAFSWVDGGLFFIKKDSFSLLIAPQNTDADLKLMLEEQTLAARGDTSLIPFFTIGSHEVMPFETTIDWRKSLPGLSENFHLFTCIDNFNVLANSIPAMRWYLGELQLGNLFLKNNRLRTLYEQTLPQRAHQFSIIHHNGTNYSLSSKIWNNAQNCIFTACETGQTAQSTETVKLIADFEVEIIPTAVQTLRKNDSVFVLLSNLNQVVLYDTLGTKIWRLNLSSDLTGVPQIIDLENDGTDEVVFFQKDQIDIITQSGKSCSGLPKKYNGISKGGIAVNYDNAFNYRFLVSVGNQVKSLDETGTAVQGWLFTGMTADLQGSVSYYVTQGKDMISFKDMTNTQYVINRRGESRLSKPVKVTLPNESGFVVGAFDESSLRKLGYRNNYIFNYYLLDGHKDSVKVDREVNALSAKWVFNNNQPLLVIEEVERVVVLDEFGYEKESVLKPEPNQLFAGLVITDGFEYVFADNSQNALYLLDGFGKMIFPVPVTGTSVFHLKDRLLYTFVGTKIKVYKTE
ncbi:MAG: hypothetical protein HYZ14_02525 [Bacteroidetes bacterium]|nr:hypothetical protein [Bacteroidota bacterium]